MKYEGKTVKITGWLSTDCQHGLRSISDDENELGIATIRPSSIESNISVQKDDLFEKFWVTCTEHISLWYNPCKKDIEVEIEGFIEENKEASKEWYSDGIRPGVLIVTRVLRIEEKYHEPPPEYCLPEPPPEEELLKRVLEDIRKQHE